jgi:hypothetical protein
MSLYVVDIEGDGPAPGLYSMVSIGLVRVDRQMKTTFRADFAPISDKWVPEALAISNITREEHEAFPDPEIGIRDLEAFLKDTSDGRPMFISDNLAYDWMWPNYYFALYDIKNPFGFSGHRIGNFYAGLEKDWFASSKWKKFRKTKHTHDPVDDAKGNVEALIHIADTYRVKIPGL